MPRTKLLANVVGPNLRTVRKTLGLTQEELAARCQLIGWDVSRSSLAQIESRIRYVSDEELLILATILGVSTDSLYPAELVKRLRKKRSRA
jgi:transcriptional regulator with XRE-family HTH domain